MAGGGHGGAAAAAPAGGRPGAELKYRRVLLKISGEALAGDQKYGISPPVVDTMTEEIRRVSRQLKELQLQLLESVGKANSILGR